MAAAANCATSHILFGINQIGLEYDDTVLIQGGGGLGLTAIAVAKEHGDKTILIKGAERRIERANELGVDHVVNLTKYETVDARAEQVRKLNSGQGADLGIEVTGFPEPFAEGVQHLCNGGRYLEIGNLIPGIETDFALGDLTRIAGMLTVHGLRTGLGKSYRQTIDILTEMPGICAEIGLTRLPHCTVFRDWFPKIPIKRYRAFLNASVEKRTGHAAIQPASTVITRRATTPTAPITASVH